MDKLTPDHLDFMRRVWTAKPLKSADRAEDKIRQQCRKAGYVKIMRNPRRWVITDAGKAALRSGE